VAIPQPQTDRPSMAERAAPSADWGWPCGGHSSESQAAPCGTLGRVEGPNQDGACVGVGGAWGDQRLSWRAHVRRDVAGHVGTAFHGGRPSRGTTPAVHWCRADRASSGTLVNRPRLGPYPCVLELRQARSMAACKLGAEWAKRGRAPESGVTGPSATCLWTWLWVPALSRVPWKRVRGTTEHDQGQRSVLGTQGGGSG